MTDIYQYCIQKEGIDSTDRILLQCALEQISRQQNNIIEETISGKNNNPARIMLLVISASCVFFMQAGFAMVCAGAVRKKNVQNTMLKNLLDACGASIAFFSFGYAFAFGGTDPLSPQKTFMGTTNFFLMNVNDYAFWLFQFAFSAASTTIVAGALAERCQMTAYLAYSIVLSGWVYPIVAHSVWDYQGILSATSIDPLWGVGMIDFAGSSVVHITGGTVALLSATIIGPRRGRFHDEKGNRLDIPKVIHGHSPSLQMLGTFILWFGWFSFNAGTALLVPLTNVSANVGSLAAANTAIATGVSAAISLFFNYWLVYRETGSGYFDLQITMNGCLAGSVAITAGCAVYEPWAALVTGFFAGIFYVLGNRLLIKLRIDDAVDAIPVHLISGIWGIISVGFLTCPTKQLAAYGRANHSGIFYEWSNGTSDATLLGTQLIGIIFIISWVTAMMLPFFLLLDYMNWLRCDALEEIVGLDAHEHGGLERVGDRPDNEDVKDDHYEAYKRRRQFKNTEILNRRTNQLHRASSVATDDVPDDNDNTNDFSVSRKSWNIDASVTTGRGSRS